MRSRTTLGVCVLACLGLAATAGDLGVASSGSLVPVTASSAGQMTGAAVAFAARPPDASVTATTVDPAAEERRRAEEAERERLAANPTPVAGLNQTQMNNAMRIVRAGQGLGLPRRALVIAVATAMQESNLYNLASTRVSESYSYPHDGSGSDHDSIGLFQQRASGSWGRVAQIMDPGYAATAFYKALLRVPGWDQMALSRAAQKVQVSAFPSAYAKHESRATTVVDALIAVATAALP